jgi:hypothetical protein
MEPTMVLTSSVATTLHADENDPFQPVEARIAFRQSAVPRRSAARSTR